MGTYLELFRQIFRNPRSEVRESVSLSEHTTLGIGGVADVMICPGDKGDLIRCLEVLTKEGRAFRILGNGANLLISDRKFTEPIVLTKRCSNISVSGNGYHVECGLLLPQLASTAAKNGHSGLEYAGGIPGTVGGAVMMNAGAHGQEWKEICIGVNVWELGRGMRHFSREECEFGYRTSVFQKLVGKAMIVEAELVLVDGEPSGIRERMKENLQWRQTHTPVQAKSCGSVFKRGPGYFPGQVIEEAGCKGLAEGRASVSTVHANYFVNQGGATFEEMRRLIGRVEQIVYEKNGIRLEREVIIWD